MEVGLDDVTHDVAPRRWSGRFDVRSVGARSREFGRRSRETLLLSAVVGVLTGVGVAGFESAVTRGLEGVNRLPLWGIAVAPFIGLTVAALALRWIGPSSSPATADEYLHAFHDPGYQLPLRALVARMIAGVATLGSGAPMGLEGPSLYLGATLGDALQQRFPRLFSAQNRRLLLVAGAAAGVAAIFKAPATGAVFALEVPYQNDLARHMLGPALVGAATSYLAFVAIHGTTPLINVTGTPPFSTKDLAAALALGLFAGLGARGFAWMLRTAKTPVAECSELGAGPDRGNEPRRDLRARPTARGTEPHDRARATTRSAGRSTRPTASRSSRRSLCSVAWRLPPRWPAAGLAGSSSLSSWRAHWSVELSAERSTPSTPHSSPSSGSRHSSAPATAFPSRRSCSSPKRPAGPASSCPASSRPSSRSSS